MEATILSATSQGRESIELIKNKVLDSLSIGFNVLESEIDEDGHRVITEIDLWEISLVTFPANKQSKISIKKHQSDEKIGEIKMNNISDINFNYENNSQDDLVNFVKSNNPAEYKSYSSDQENMGEYAISSERYNNIISKISEISPMRKLASVDSISTNLLELLIQHGEFQAGWVGERDERKEFDEPKLINKKIRVHEIYAQPKATQRLLDDSFVNIESWITDQLVQSFAKIENDAFILGDGNEKPRGILSYEDEIEIIQSNKQSNLDLDDILNLINSLEETYQPNASFLMNRRTLAELQRIKDENGRFIWQASISEKSPGTLFGIPVFCSSAMPSINENKIAVAFGDFKNAYKIIDRQGISLMKDPYTEKPFVKFYATRRVGGDVINQDAIKLLKISA